MLSHLHASHSIVPLDDSSGDTDLKPRLVCSRGYAAAALLLASTPLFVWLAALPSPALPSPPSLPPLPPPRPPLPSPLPSPPTIVAILNGQWGGAAGVLAHVLDGQEL